MLNEEDAFKGDIVYHRFFEGKTFEEIGALFFQSKQSIDYLEKTSLRFIENRFKDQEAIVNFKTFIQSKITITESELMYFLKDYIDQEDIPYFNILFSCFNYMRLPKIKPNQLNGWCSKKYPMRKIFDSMKLNRSDIYNFNDFENPELVKNIVKILPDIHYTDDQFYFIDITCKDYAYRLLKSKQEPMHIKFLLYGNITTRNLSVRLCRDPRFKPFGKSGCWGLSEWNPLMFIPTKKLVASY